MPKREQGKDIKSRNVSFSHMIKVVEEAENLPRYVLIQALSLE